MMYIYIYIYICIYNKFNKYIRENVTKTYEHLLQKVLKIEIINQSYKKAFPYKLSFRLINSSKSDISKNSRNLLDKIKKKSF